MRSLLSFAVILLAVSIARPCPAQETSGTLYGRAVDPGGAPVAFADVRIQGSQLQGVRVGSTGKDGYFQIPQLPPGDYTLELRRMGYEPVKLGATVWLGRTTYLGDVPMGGKDYEAEEVVVWAPRPMIDPLSVAAGANLRASDFERLPLERNYQSLAVMLPQANTSYLGDGTNLCGATSLENRYFIEGVDVTDPFRGVTSLTLPYNFIRELQVRTGGYEPEYRSALGGLVNVVTYSGGNEVKANAFGYFTNNQFAGDQRIGSGQPASGDYSYYDLGLSLGGPVVRDALWYYVAYNPKIQNEDVEVPGVGYYPDKTVSHSFAGKLTWRAGDRTDLALTVLGDPTTRDAVAEMFGNWGGTPTSFSNPDPFLNHIETGALSVAATAKHTAGSSVILNGSLSYLGSREKWTPSSGRPGTMFMDTETGVWSGENPRRMDAKSRVVTGDVAATWFLDSHTLKAGVGYRENHLDLHDVASAIYGTPSISGYVQYDFMTRGVVKNRVPSAFAQDSWKVTDRLRLLGGLRWSGDVFVNSSGRTTQKILDEWQPRLGFTFLPGERERNKIFGSVGRFYQEISTWAICNYYTTDSHFYVTGFDHDPRLDPSGGSTEDWSSGVQGEIDGMKGQYYDELALGYERALGTGSKVGARGIYRTLREAIEDGMNPETGVFFLGNPGKGELSAFPRPKRDYTALELTFSRLGVDRLDLMVSYVLSRNKGNYPGLFNSDFEWDFPNSNGSFDLLEMTAKSAGLLPNDRTHVFKVVGSYRMTPKFSAGAFGSWMSGTPRSEYVGVPFYLFLEDRGSGGRTPSIWDLNLRFAYDLRLGQHRESRGRLVVDLLHVASQRKPVDFDQSKYVGADPVTGEPIPNPTYGYATRYQPPMALRMGLEVLF